MYRVTYYRQMATFASLDLAVAFAQGVTSFGATMGRGNSAKSALLTGPGIRLRVRAAGEKK